MAAPARTHVFISYSHADAEWLTRLQIMLKPLTRNQAITVWDDTRIQAGSRWREDIERALASARVAVLLVSPNFLALEFIANDEIPPLLKASVEDGLSILWVAVSSSLYEVTDIAAYQAANNPATPLDALSPAALNAELVKIAQKIRHAATRPVTLTPADTRASAPQPMAGEPLRPYSPSSLRGSASQPVNSSWAVTPNTMKARLTTSNRNTASICLSITWRRRR